MGGGNLASKNKKKGFAISGILYPLLILTLFLVVQILMMMQNRKNVLDKVRTELAESINIANKIYTNEELSILIDELTNNFLDKTYPVGSIYISYNSTNPKDLFGGTWVNYGSGRVLKGISSGSAGSTGGSDTVTLSTSNLPAHTHSIPSLSGSTNSTGAHTHSYSVYLRNYHTAIGNGNPDVAGNANGNTGKWTSDSSGSHSHTVTTKASTSGQTGSGTAINIENPYITVYMWRRTA